ncbi:MAG TPA: NUDIX domain-containing protein [Candidatus Saccharimonadia bacterium]|nr:NUDIX domain-containing protein [Candidatus Saccharimonadia bacterium]
MKQTPSHPLQRSILEHLRLSTDGLRYRDMKPAHVENDLYNYHLQYLAKQELVAKRGQRYVLSPRGKKYLIELNPLDESGQSSRFKLAALCLLTRGRGAGMQLLYQHRGRQPFAGQRGIIGGGIKRGEPVTQTARRRLREEAGLTADFKLLGLMRKIHFDTNGELYSDILFHVCLSRDYEGDLVRENDFGSQEWVSLEEAIEIERSAMIGSKHLAEVLSCFRHEPGESIPLFYFEDTYHHDIY